MPWNQLGAAIIAYLGILGGVGLAANSPEEVRPGKRAFSAIRLGLPYLVAFWIGYLGDIRGAALLAATALLLLVGERKAGKKGIGRLIGRHSLYLLFSLAALYVDASSLAPLLIGVFLAGLVHGTLDCETLIHRKKRPALKKLANLALESLVTRSYFLGAALIRILF